MKRLFLAPAFLALSLIAAANPANAHPHVFVEAEVELIQNEKGEFVEVKHRWVFDPIFSATVMLDFDTDQDEKLSEAEMNEVEATILKNIEEYDFFTWLRTGDDVVYFEAPKELVGKISGDEQVEFSLSVRLDKPVASSEKPFRISISDSSYYVAFEVKSESSIKVSGPASNCKQDLKIPDYDNLYSSDIFLNENVFDEQADNKPLELGDEFYTWIELKCGLPS